jgi:transcriptional regulator with XRE-family HTH domain
MKSKFFAAAINRRRLDIGWTQEMLAEKAGINRTTYGAIERAERALSDQNLVRLSIALDAPLEEILAEAYRLHYVTLLGIERDVRRKMGLAVEPAERPAAEAGREMQQTIESLVGSLKSLLLSHFRTSGPAADFLRPEAGALLDTPPAPVRRRARPSRRKPPSRR